MNRLYLLRHGEADHPPGVSFANDASRPLNAAGMKKLGVQASGLRALGVVIDGIVTSPYLRARQTAEIVADAYGLADRIVESPNLEPGASLRELRKSLKGMPGQAILAVGHAPDLGEIVGELTGGAPVPLGKGWLAWIELEDGDLRAGTGRLKALLPAQIAAAAGRR